MAHMLVMSNLAMVKADPGTGSTTLEIRQIIGLGQTFRHHLTLLVLNLDPRLRDLVIRFLRFASPRMTHEQPLSGWPLGGVLEGFAVWFGIDVENEADLHP